MNCSNYYFLREKKDSYFARAIYKQSSVSKSECPLCNSLRRRLTDPLNISFKGIKKGNFYKVTNYNLVDSKLQKILLENCPNDFVLKDVNIIEWKNIDEKYMNSLKMIEPIYTCGLVHDKHGKVVEYCPKCYTMDYDKKELVEGLTVSEEKVDGKMLFSYDNLYGMIIINEKLKKILEKEGITNIDFTNLKDLSFR